MTELTNIDTPHLDEVVAHEMNHVSAQVAELNAQLRGQVGPDSIARSVIAAEALEAKVARLIERLRDEGMKSL